MPLTLKQFGSVHPGNAPDELTVLFADGTRTSLVAKRTKTNFEIMRKWLNDKEQGDWVAVDEESGVLLPATFSFALYARPITAAERDLGVSLKFFAQPRPAQLYVRLGGPGEKRLGVLIDEAIADKKGAVIAVSDGFWVEDIVLISSDAAKAELGILAQ